MARAEIKKQFARFMVQMRTRKFASEIYWLSVYKCNSLTQGSKKVEYDRRKVKVAGSTCFYREVKRKNESYFRI